MVYNGWPTPEDLKVLANDPIFPKGGFWNTRLLACAEGWQEDIKKATYLNRCEKRYHYFVGPGRCWCGKAALPPEDR